MKKTIRNKLLIAAFAFGIIGNINFAFADDGKWVQSENQWWYQNADGTYLQNEWLEEDQKWYYLDSEGYMTTGWTEVGKQWYYLDSNGVMKDGWLNLDGDWYYLGQSGAMQTGWNNIENNWYYLDESGQMRTGWQEDINGSWYYFGDTGALKIGWFQADGKWYYSQTDGTMQTGWLRDGQDWYYLQEDGSMAADTWIDDCYLNPSGVWNKVAQSDDYGIEVEPVTLTESQVIEKINTLRAKFPEGMYWNHMGMDPHLTNNSEIVTGIPCDHNLYNITYCNNYVLGNVRGYQCDGFARKMSDLVFTPEAPILNYDYEFSKVKVGDYIRYNDIHTVFVIGKGADYIDTVEVNYGGTCMIHWDGRLSKATLDTLRIEAFSRY